jgi:O-antigen/teichoic acid export membrane protein
MLLPVVFKTRFVFDSVLWRKMISYSFPLLLAGLSGSINDAIDKILLRRMIGEEDGLAIVGKYGAAYKIGVLMALFIQMFRFAAEPFFFERSKHNDAKETYAFVMKYFIIIMLIVFLAINLYISGLQYIVAWNYRDAMVVVPIISMAYLLYGVYINHSIWYKLNDLTRYAVYITVIGALITLIINLLFIPAYGYLASAWAHVFSYGAMIIFSFIFAEKHYKVRYEMNRLLSYFVLAIAIVVFAHYHKYNSIAGEMVINTFLILAFIGYAQYRDKLLTVFFVRE